MGGNHHYVPGSLGRVGCLVKSEGQGTRCLEYGIKSWRAEILGPYKGRELDDGMSGYLIGPELEGGRMAGHLDSLSG